MDSTIGIALIAAPIAFILGMFIGERIAKEGFARITQFNAQRIDWLTAENARLKKAAAVKVTESREANADLNSIVRAAQHIPSNQKQAN